MPVVHYPTPWVNEITATYLILDNWKMFDQILDAGHTCVSPLHHSAWWELERVMLGVSLPGWTRIHCKLIYSKLSTDLLSITVDFSLFLWMPLLTDWGDCMHISYGHNLRCFEEGFLMILVPPATRLQISLLGWNYRSKLPVEYLELVFHYFSERGSQLAFILIIPTHGLRNKPVHRT